MTVKPGRRDSRRQAPKPAASAPDSARPAKTPGHALPADLGRSLRLLDDDALDRLVRAAIQEARRRGRDVPQGAVEDNRPSEPTGPAKGRSKTTAAPDRAGAVTPGQERLVLAAHEAGLAPAAIAREFRLSRAAVQQVIAAARGGRRKTER